MFQAPVFVMKTSLKTVIVLALIGIPFITAHTEQAPNVPDPCGSFLCGRYILCMKAEKDIHSCNNKWGPQAKVYCKECLRRRYTPAFSIWYTRKS